MAGDGYHCWKCGAELVVDPREPVARSATCDGCGADMRVCMNCEFHDPTAYNECREPTAERVKERDRANFCDHFRLRKGAGGGGSGRSAADEAKAALEALFRKK